MILVFSTAASKKEARHISKILLQKKLAACVNIIPGIESHYRWKGRIETGKEFLLLIKTKAALFGKLEKAVRENHSYSVPEIVAVSLEKGSKSYLDWLREAVV